MIGPRWNSWVLRLPFNEAFRLKMDEWDVEVPGLPESLDGLSILHVSDLHLSHAFTARYFDRIAEILADGPEPDLVAITGDFVDDDDVAGWLVPSLSKLRGRLGQFAILGNHDYRHPLGPILAALDEAGFDVLEAEWRKVEADGCSLAIGGTVAPWGREPDPRQMPEADLRILLSHAPDEVYRAASWGIDLMLAGHVHGGQVRLPVLGAILMPSRYSRRFDRGFFRRGPTLLHVSQGVAGKHPLRWHCPPEAVRLVLRAPKHRARAVAAGESASAT